MNIYAECAFLCGCDHVTARYRVALLDDSHGGSADVLRERDLDEIRVERMIDRCVNVVLRKTETECEACNRNLFEICILDVRIKRNALGECFASCTSLSLELIDERSGGEILRTGICLAESASRAEE